MANIKIYGFDEVIQKINNAEKNSSKIIGKSVYEGANIIADTVKQAIKELPVDEHHGTSDNPTKGLKQVQKLGLEHGFGIAPLQDDKGFTNVKLGFDGYNLIKTKTHPNGQPNAMIARATESGTSFSNKIPFMRDSLNKSRNQAKKKMAETFENEINKIVK